MGYLVTLGRATTITCKEIIEKFEQIALGESSLDLSLFKNRSMAVNAGMEAGAEADARLRDEQPHLTTRERAGRVGVVAADAARNCASLEDDELPKVLEDRLEDDPNVTEESLIQEVSLGYALCLKIAVPYPVPLSLDIVPTGGSGGAQ